MTTEAAEIRDNMGVTDKVRGGNWWQKIAAAEMQYNGDIVDGYIGKFSRWQPRRRRNGDRTDAEMPEIVVFG